MSTPPAIYELLRSLPLFNGISFPDLQRLVGDIPFEFEKYAPGDLIMEARQPNTTLRFILSGRARALIRNSTDRLRLSYILEGPSVIAPEFVFGRNTRVPMRVEAETAISAVSLSKANLVKLLQASDIFLFNYLNIISAYAQKGIDGVISLTGGRLEERIAFWLIALTPVDAKEIQLQSKHRDLYTMFGVQRSSFIATLDGMRDQGLISYDVRGISVIDRKGLRDLLLSTPLPTHEEDHQLPD